MAPLSNRDRVGRAIELLRDGLAPFIEQTMAGIAPGADWAAMLGEAKGRDVDPQDVQTQLFLLTERFGALFKERLPWVARSYANELRDYRNAWAHTKPFSNDDTHRMLDTAERLLTLAGAPQQAEAVRRSRLDHQHQSYEAETKKLAKQQDSGVQVAGQGLKPWREVLPPHDDVASGNFNAGEFAADLHMVAFPDEVREAGTEYSDPAEFFRRTYLTEGLTELLDRAVRRVDGDENASPIVNLQTNFGGGKTHSMLALWHLFSGAAVSSLPQDVQDLVGERTLPREVKRVALVGTHLDPGSTRTMPDGTNIQTIWGELAWQLGGRPAYDLIADADRNRTNPGQRLRDLLTAHSPCLILIDEWVAYARQLWNREELPAGTFDTQFTFAQSLTEIVKGVPGALLVISIPASHDPERPEGAAGSAIEVGGPNGQEALHRLQNVVRRLADQWRPASSQESFEIVRRRLFTEPDGQARADIAAVARTFKEFYARGVGEFPKGVAEPEYERRIRAAYPLHPELFDRLYEDWSTLERFQRTRGVLRLMSSVVHALWVAQDPSPIILPSTVPLGAPTVASEITQYLPDSWKPIIDKDIDGEDSTPARIDAERPTFGQRAITRRLARTIFLGSAPTLSSAHRGIERQQVWLGTAMPGDTVGNFGSAVDVLSQRATYFYADANRYWFDTQASINRTASDYADGLRDKPEEAWTEIRERLRATEPGQRGGFAAVSVAPESSAEVPDNDEVRLVILHPSQPHTKGSSSSPAMAFAQDTFERRGSAQRTNRNMVLFLAPDSKRLDELMESTRQYLAWASLRGRETELNLPPQQQALVESNITRYDQDVTVRVAQTYQWAIVPEEEPGAPATLSTLKVEGSDTRLAARVTDKLTRSGQLSLQVAPRSIRLDLDQKLASVWRQGHVALGELWAYYCRYPYMLRLRNRAVLNDGVKEALSSLAWELEAFALADGYDEASSRYTGLVCPGGDAQFGQLTDATLLVAPEAARKQADDDAAGRGGTTSDGESQPGSGSTAGGSDGSGAGHDEGGSVERHPNVRFHGVFQADPERYARDLSRVSQEVLQQLAAVDGANLEVTVEVRATCDTGFPVDKVRVVSENARTLKFQQASFEDD